VDKNGTQQLERCLTKNSQKCWDALDVLKAFEEATAPKVAQVESAIEIMLQGLKDALEVMRGQDNGPKDI